MGKVRRRFDLQFKNQICQAIESGARTVKEVCQEQQLASQLVYMWLARSSRGELQKRSPDRLVQLERENEKLKSKVGELTMMVDVLKKMENWKKQQKNEQSSVFTSKNVGQFQRPVVLSESQARAFTTGLKTA